MSMVFIFPGQGSQSVGMLADVAQAFCSVKTRFEEASDALGYDLWEIVSNGPDAQLNQTEITQPAILTASVALYEIARAQGHAAPSYMAGHSLGEYSALVAAEALQFTDAVKLVAARGQFMQTAVPAGTGAMAAVIGLADDKVAAACEQAAEGQVVAPVNYNSPGQVVIAGDKLAVERAAEACRQAGAKRVLPLPVSVPSHCALMQPAAEQLAAALADVSIHLPTIPVIHNVDVKAATSVEGIRSALVKQLYSPVRWTETISWLGEQGVTQAFEIGPGKVLTGLTKRIVADMSCEPLNTAAALNA